MRKILFIFGLLLFAIGVNAQTVIKNNGVTHYLYGDTLIKDASFSVTYYIKDFAENARLTLVTDTMASAAQHPKVQAVVSRSLNNSDFVSVAGDTVTATSTAASGHITATGLFQNIYYNYLKITVKAVDSTQNTKVQYYLLIDKNQ